MMQSCCLAAYASTPRPFATLGSCQIRHTAKRDESIPVLAAERIPFSAKLLTGIINTTEVPFSTYVAQPRTPLHFVDARIKQVWLVALLILIPRVYWQLRIGLVVAIVLLTLVCLPPRLSRAQLGRLLPLAMLLFTTTAVTSDQVMMSGPSHLAPPDVQGLPSIESLNGGYQYVMFKFLFFTISRFSISLGVTVASIAFSVLQLTSLFLISTPPEQAANAFRWFAAPLRLFRVPVDTITFQLLLSLRFVSLVFEELRNLALGLAARAVPWSSMTRNDAIGIWALVINKLFSNLFRRSANMAESLMARGFQDPEERHLNVPVLLQSSVWANMVAIASLAGCVYFAVMCNRWI
eukprot:jgi/Ulvmu1/6239/UM028_0097.1